MTTIETIRFRNDTSTRKRLYQAEAMLRKLHLEGDGVVLEGLVKC